MFDKAKWQRAYRGAHPEYRKRDADAQRLRREEHPERMRAISRASQKRAFARNVAWRDGYLLAHPCVDCGATEDLCFHHVDPGPGDVRIAQLLRHSLARVQKEAVKCVVLCRSCHSRLHRSKARCPHCRKLLYQ